MRIAIASDHAGYRHKQIISAHLADRGYEVVDYGTHSEEPVDYPDFIRPAAQSVAESVERGECEKGIVLGGSGNGEAITANRIRGIRCAVCWNTETARLATAHNDANMISLGARFIGQQEALAIVDSWLAARFEGGRHIPRIEKLDRP